MRKAKEEKEVRKAIEEEVRKDAEEKVKEEKPQISEKSIKAMKQIKKIMEKTEENQKKIWERFYKIDASRGKDKRGTGLGLAIVKEIIQRSLELHDLDIPGSAYFDPQLGYLYEYYNKRYNRKSTIW